MTSLNPASALYWGSVGHLRATPIAHRFSYPLLLLAINVRNISHLPWPLLWNHRGILTVLEKDYLPGPGTTLLERLATRFTLAANQEVILLTMPRCLGYVFNPVNFYLILNQDLTLNRLIAEVHNTFGETHVYECPANQQQSSPLVSMVFPKEFYVSPFLSCNGDYQLVLEQYGEDLGLNISLRQEACEVFSAWISANRKPLTSAHLIRSLTVFGIGILLVMCRIHWQALLLTLRRGATVFVWRRRNASGTISSHQTWIHKLRLLILRALGRIAPWFRKTNRELL